MANANGTASIASKKGSKPSEKNNTLSGLPNDVGGVPAGLLDLSALPEPLIDQRFDANAMSDSGLAMKLNQAYQTAQAVSGLAEIVRANLLDCSPIYKTIPPVQEDALLNAITLLGDSLAVELDHLAIRIDKDLSKKRGN
jgi:hypothetical protein